MLEQLLTHAVEIVAEAAAVTAGAPNEASLRHELETILDGIPLARLTLNTYIALVAKIVAALALPDRSRARGGSCTADEIAELDRLTHTVFGVLPS